MFLCDCQRIECRDAGGFLAVLNGKALTQSADNGELSIYDRKRSAEEEQVAGVRTLHIGTQRCWWWRQHDTEFAEARTRTAFGGLITTWRLHVLLHQFRIL